MARRRRLSLSPPRQRWTGAPKDPQVGHCDGVQCGPGQSLGARTGSGRDQPCLCAAGRAALVVDRTAAPLQRNLGSTDQSPPGYVTSVQREKARSSKRDPVPTRVHGILFTPTGNGSFSPISDFVPRSVPARGARGRPSIDLDLISSGASRARDLLSEGYFTALRGPSGPGAGAACSSPVAWTRACDGGPRAPPMRPALPRTPARVCGCAGGEGGAIRAGAAPRRAAQGG
eukprot:scaffold12_cov337-Prasinococcus_capsulatus_cf.AAC.4